MHLEEEEEEDDTPAFHPLHGHNPWGEQNAPDPDEDDISGFEWRSNGPNGVRFTGTFRTVASPGPHGYPRMEGGGQNNPMMLNFANMLTGILGGRPPGGIPQQGPTPAQAHMEQERPRSAPGDGPPNVHVHHGGGPGIRWTATTSTRLFPRDANHPQPQGQPFDELPALLQQMFAAPGMMPPHQQGHMRDPFGNQADVGFGPIAGLLNLFNPANMQHGDAVYSQEALDRIISQLMEQNQTGNAPGPASSEAIGSLPQKTISESDLDDTTHKAECSICMDEVNLGDKVTLLPCHHWFHGECIKAWLGEHDTCPHCRQGIMPKDAPNGDNRSRNPGEAPRHDQMWASRMKRQRNGTPRQACSSAPLPSSHHTSTNMLLLGDIFCQKSRAPFTAIAGASLELRRLNWCRQLS
ncbi:hypothetical protein M8818_001557 [Zalaria obscura]|uniref:Uncharacterized protein n=1 Tax=Zalaria obscura TaxID=2024903 RepID=A0ACC3SL74_9PEZI